MRIGKIINVTPWEYSSKKNKFWATVTLEDDVSGIVMVDNKDATTDFKTDEVISYELSEVGDHKFLIGVSVLGYSSAVARDLSIKKQTAFKAAVELFNANPVKGRWMDKDSPTGLNTDDMVRDIKALTDKLFTIVN